MDFFSKPLSDSNLYVAHNQITYLLIFCWLLVCFLGYYIKDKNIKRNITIFLLSISLFQEVFDYINRFFLNEIYSVTISIQKDLPLQLCHFAYWLSVLCLLSQIYNNKHKQFYFNCAYFLGFSGALQGIITVDLTGIFTFSDMLTLHLQHSLIILNVLWLIFAYNYKFTKKSILQTFLFTNILVVIVSFINYIIDSNYMFLCSPPDVNNPLLIGDWPYYILVLELVFFIYGYILYLPFKLREIFITKD